MRQAGQSFSVDPADITVPQRWHLYSREAVINQSPE
jgi:hypothetical protein